MKSKISAVLFAIAAMIGIPLSALANTLYFPQVAFGGGYSTTFTLTNTGTSSVSSTLTFYAQNGNVRTDLSKPVTLAAGSSTRITLPNTGTGITVVSGEIAAGAGTVQGVASFELRNGAQLTTVAGVLGIDPGDSFLLPVDVAADGSANTGVALANTSASPISVRLRLIGEDGSQVAANSTTFGSLVAHGQAADFATAWFPQINGTTFRGTLVVERTAGPINSLVATALTAKEDILSGLAVIPSTNLGTAGRTLYFPQVAYGGGYSTTFVLINTGLATINSSLNFFTQAGVARTDLNRAVTIPPNGSARVSLPNTGTGITVVWGEFSPGNGTVKGVAAFEVRNGGKLQTIAGILGLEAGNSFNLPVDVAADGSASTGIAIANASGSSAFTVNLRLLNESGVIVSPATVSAIQIGGEPTVFEDAAVPFVARQQVADFLPRWFPQLAGTTFKGVLVVEAPSTAPANSLIATALTVKEGVLSALPVSTGSIAGTSSGGGGGGGGNLGGGPASQCMDPNAASATTIVLTYGFSGTITGTQTSNITQNLNVSFQGNVGSEYVTSQTTTYTAPPAAAGTYLTNSKSYSTRQGNEILNFGSILNLTSPLAGTATVVFNPVYREKKYTLNAGESIAQTQSQTTTSEFTGLPPITQSATNTTTTRYLGQESVTAPAGTFNTCKFEVGNQTSWEAVGRGVLIKSVSTDSGGGTTTMTLTSGTINGSAIVP